MFELLSLIIGAALGLIAVTSGTFREGGGLVLAFICVAAIVVAAVAGALSALLPAYIATWTGRIALGCLAFAVSCFLADR